MAIATALTIAGSDSGGGAGIQADLKTFAFHCVHGTSALTCVTAQNTTGVDRVDALPPAAVVAQIEAVARDIEVGAAKTGMLLNAEIIEAVAAAARAEAIGPLVVDPVMVSRAGAQLVDDLAVATLKEKLLPLAMVITPNRYEAQILGDLEIATLADMETAARRIFELGPQSVLVKGGGMKGDLKGIDLWFDGAEFLRLPLEPVPAVETHNTHGTGCTLSAAIAANLALGRDLPTAIAQAKEYVTRALHHALDVGRGSGPVGHFYPLLA